jgi:hypothetical protein
MDKYVSTKLQVISFFLIILVVFIHSYNFEIKLIGPNMMANHGYAYLIEGYFKNGLATIAVPMFFSISGYLFFLGFSGSLKEFVNKFKKRTITVLIPYIFWSAFGLLFYFLLQIIPHTKSFFTKELIVNYSLTKLLYTWLVDPIPYQFWFIRDLILIILITPLIFLLIKYFRYTLLIVCMSIWIIGLNTEILNIGSVTFFVLGASISTMHPNIINQVFYRKYWIITPVWMIFLVCKTLYMSDHLDSFWLIIIHRVCILIGMISAWSIYDVFLSRSFLEEKNYFWVFSYSFFLFAFHEPILTIVKKFLLSVLPRSEAYILASFFLTSLIVIIVSILVGSLIKKVLPSIYGVISGGR